MQMKSLVPEFPIERQLTEAAGPVVLMNIFTFDPPDEAAFLTAWAEDAAFMKSQPGFIAAQLHRAVGPFPAYFNYATWESVEAFCAAFSDPGFLAGLRHYPASAVAQPHLFQRVAVPGICTA